MGRLIPELMKEPKEMSVEELEHLFLWYGKRKGDASVEGLGTIATSIGIAFADFIIRIGNNIRTTFGGMFKDFKRSALAEVFQAHKLGMIQVYDADYTALQNVSFLSYPFTISPQSVGMYCKDSFELIKMEQRLISIIEEYFHLSAAVKVGDVGKAIAIFNKINTLNMKEQLNVKDMLINMVASRFDSKTVTFGSIFNSVDEFKESCNIALLSADELDKAMRVGKMLDKLYQSYDKLKEGIQQAAKSSFDLSQFAGITTTIFNTGELIESYALLVKEYHHLEFWLMQVAHACMNQIKK